MNTATAEKQNKIMYISQAENFSKIPGSPIAYWLSSGMFNAFNGLKLNDYGITRLGMTTGENARFVRLWYEVDRENEDFTVSSQNELDRTPNRYWVPYNKGGEYRKWYGNNECVVFWKENGKAIKNFADEKTGRIRSTVPNTEYYFKLCASWSKISSGRIAFRCKNNSIFDVAGACLFANENNTLFYLMGILNSNVVMALLEAMSPTLNFEGGQISSLPIVYSKENDVVVENIVNENIRKSKSDWDSFETSWDFKKHPLI